MPAEIRKFVTFEEEVLIEGFRACPQPWHLWAAVAVVTNPWAGRFVEDLKPGIQELGPELGEALTSRMLKLAGGGDTMLVDVHTT